MTVIFNMNAIYKPSEGVIAKNIEGQVIIVPLIAGTGNLNDELFQLNNTGSEVWELLDGKNRMKDIIAILSQKYEESFEVIENDVVKLVRQLIKKNYIIETI